MHVRVAVGRRPVWQCQVQLQTDRLDLLICVVIDQHLAPTMAGCLSFCGLSRTYPEADDRLVAPELLAEIRCLDPLGSSPDELVVVGQNKGGLYLDTRLGVELLAEEDVPRAQGDTRGTVYLKVRRRDVGRDIRLPWPGTAAIRHDGARVGRVELLAGGDAEGQSRRSQRQKGEGVHIKLLTD